MISDNKAFYINLWANIKQYGPIAIFFISLFFSALPFITTYFNIDLSLLKHPENIVNVYFLILFQLLIASITLNKKWSIKIISIFIWGIFAYWYGFLFFLSVALNGLI